MNLETFTLVWLIGGAVLMLAELLIPGAVVSFVGLAALLVGLGHMVGLLETVVHMFTAWFVLSIVFLFTLRGLVMRFLPGETKVAPTDEDLAAYGTVVEVVESVPEMGSPGRIQFQGSGWPALSLDGTLPTGSKVRLVFRENLVWYVEPAGEDALLSDGEPDPFGD